MESEATQDLTRLTPQPGKLIAEAINEPHQSDKLDQVHLESRSYSSSPQIADVDESAQVELPDKVAQVNISSEYNELLGRRDYIMELNAKSQLVNGDSYFLIPQDWCTRFLYDHYEEGDESIQEKIGPIDTASLLDETGYLVDEDAKHTYVNGDIFQILVSWYGLAPGSQPVKRNVALIDGQLVVDVYCRAIFPHILCSPSLLGKYLNFEISPFFFSSSGSIKELKEKLVALFGLEGKISRIWLIQGDNLPLVFSPETLDNLKSRQLLSIVKKQMHQRLGNKCDILIEVQQDNKEWIMNLLTVAKPGSGLTGLNNLGNTCYMNSALQCLVHIPELFYYFFGDTYQKEINYDNPLGSQGKVAVSFANLIKHLYDPSNSSTAVAPRDFKTTIGHLNSMFADYHQQDSQEFIAFLLDGLHEDLNRILQKPYVEKPELPEGKATDLDEIKKLSTLCWEAHKKRNDSFVVDLFVGMYKSTLTCPECGKISITFDPYNDLTLPLPVHKTWDFTVKILLEEGYPLSLDVELPKSSTFYDLKHYIAGKLNLSANELIALEIFNSQVYKNFESKDSDIRYLPVGDLINKNDNIWFYQVSHGPGDLVVPVFNTLASDHNYQVSKPFGIPFFITLNEEERASYESIKMKLEQRINQLSTFDYCSLDRKRSNSVNSSNDEGWEKIKPREGEEINETSKTSSPISDMEILPTPVSYLSSEFDSNNNDLESSLPSPKLNNNDHFSVKLFDSTKERPFSSGRFSRFPRRLGGYNRHTMISEVTEEEDDSLWVPINISNFSKLPDILADSTTPEGHLTLAKTEEFQSNSSKEGNDVADVVSSTSRFSEMHPSDSESLIDDDPMDIVALGADEQHETDESMSGFDSPAPVDDLSDEDSGFESDALNEDPETIIKSDAEVLPKSGGDDCNGDLERSMDLERSQVGETSEVPVFPVKLVAEKNALICQWNQDSFDTFFTGLEPEDKGGKETWSQPAAFINEELIALRREREEQSKKNISLDDCMKLFSAEEILGENDLWFCPQCKEHRQATKKLDIWSVPDILTVHLKRFENQKSFSDKIDAIVDFPIEGLDMSKYSVSGSGEELIYDLFAVDNHYGGLGGGHYTSYAKNFIDNKWYYYDDSRVSTADPQNSIKPSAYLLFYRKRSNKPLGGRYFQKLLNEYQERENKVQEFKRNFEKEIQKFRDDEAVSREDDGDEESETDHELNPGFESQNEESSESRNLMMSAQSLDSILSSNQNSALISQDLKPRGFKRRLTSADSDFSANTDANDLTTE